MTLRVSVETDLAKAEDALAGAPFLLSAAWWRCVVAAALPPGAEPRFLTVSQDGRAVCVVPLLRHTDGHMTALATPYTLAWRPVTRDTGVLTAAGEAAARACRGSAVLRLEALDADWPGLAPFVSGLQSGGRAVRWFRHFGNWHETQTTHGWPKYLAARPGVLRETIRRKQARADRDPTLRITLARTPPEAAEALLAYQDVYRRSWKQPEPYPRFDACLTGAAAAAGVLRMGVFWREATPIAAQYWIVEHGTATVLKLAHDEAHRALSPGTVLTAWMIRHLMQENGVTALDFGRGDDPYKRDWVGERRQRMGLLACDPWHPRGLAALLRHDAGRAVAAVRRLRGGPDQLSSSLSQYR